jgi:protocatechuate 3,4-dioxygenase beta subunit
MCELDETPTRLDRRAVLLAAGAAGLAAAFGPRALGLLSPQEAAAATACLLMPQAAGGPYWVEDTMTRRDIREGKPGLPLQLRFAVVNARTCKAIRGADVEVWHADAAGAYSGFDGASSGGGRGAPGGGGGVAQTATRYLRGHQRSDAAGRAEFLTVFPGWYPGRTPHIHMKVHVGGDVVHTGQVFLDEKTTATVYRTAPYAERGQPDTPHAADMLFQQAGGARAQLKLAKRPSGARGYLGTIVVGVAV